MAKRRNDAHRVKYSTGRGNLGFVKNRESSWRALKDKLRTPGVDSDITFAQYMKLPKEGPGGQDDRKARPGFLVGGPCHDGKRNLQSMQYRWLICLDIDEATPEQMEHLDNGLSEVFRWEFFAHTTRKHTALKPRWRMIFPLKRKVNFEEFNAVARIIASQVFDDPVGSMDAVDDVSFRLAQVMFLPSVSRDQELEVIDNEGALLDPDSVLGDFAGDWTDFTQLPYSETRGAKGPTDPNARAEDPREKEGHIGAWCRTYTVEDVIADHLSDIYEPGDASGSLTRYSFIAGSTSNGAIVYDDGLFLYSNHGTDPAAERSVNAFDLVRIHLFGHLDEGKRADTTPSNLPSFKEMVKLVETDEKAMQELAQSRYATAEMFDDLDDEDDAEDYEPDKKAKAYEPDIDPDYPITAASFEDLGDEDDDLDRMLDGKETDSEAEEPKQAHNWVADLIVDKFDIAKPVYHNVVTILVNDPRVAPCIALNEFTREVVRVKPFREGKKNKLGLVRRMVRNKTDGDLWSNADYGNCMKLLSTPKRLGGYEFDVGRDKLRDALGFVAEQNAFHPVRDQLERFERTWQRSDKGTDAVGMILGYLDLEDNAYHREAWRAFLVASVARVYEPGAKFDCVPILAGAQGARKSTFIRVLALGRFKELSSDFDNPGRMIESMKGGWICEAGELSGFRKAEVETIKKFFSATEDQFRLAYQISAENHLRQCTFVGSTNQDTYLKDPTGNRRFWPMKLSKSQANPIDTDGLMNDLPLIWGEIVAEYRRLRKEQPHGDLFLDLRSPEALATAAALQSEAREMSLEEQAAEVIMEYLDTPVSQSVADGDDDCGFEPVEGEPMFVRTMVTPAALFDALHGDPVIREIRNANVVLGRAMKHVEGWADAGERTRRFGRMSQLWVRRGTPPAKIAFSNRKGHKSLGKRTDVSPWMRVEAGPSFDDMLD